MSRSASIILFVGACLVIAGAVVGFRPIAASISGDLHQACGSVFGGGVTAPPPICAQPLRDAGTLALGLAGVGMAMSAGALIFGRQ